MQLIAEAFSLPQSLRNGKQAAEEEVFSNANRTPLDKNTKDQSKIVSHIKELINNVSSLSTYFQKSMTFYYVHHLLHLGRRRK